MARASRSSKPEHPVLQWIMAGLGLGLTVTAAGIIFHDAIQPPSPPDLTVEVTSTRPASQGFVAELEVRNEGRQAAAGVQVLGRSGSDTASATIDYVPGRGATAVALAFPGAAAPVEARVTGWSEP